MAAEVAHTPDARVLVVDDEDNIRRLLALTLKRLSAFNITVDTAGTAEDGKRLLDQHAYQLIITDYRMPGRSGVDLLAYANQVYPDTARMLITAYAEMDIGVEAVNRGRVDGFVRKPWDGRKLVALVESLIGARVDDTPASVPPARAAATTPPARAAPAPAPARASAPAPRRSELEAELRDVDKALRQLRVRLGLGGISAEGFQRANTQLTQRKATIEVALMKLASTQ